MPVLSIILRHSPPRSAIAIAHDQARAKDTAGRGGGEGSRSERCYFPSSAHTADAWAERSCCSRASVGAAIFSVVVTERRPSAVAAAHCTYPGKLPVWP